MLNKQGFRVTLLSIVIASAFTSQAMASEIYTDSGDDMLNGDVMVNDVVSMDVDTDDHTPITEASVSEAVPDYGFLEDAGYEKMIRETTGSVHQEQLNVVQMKTERLQAEATHLKAQEEYEKALVALEKVRQEAIALKTDRDMLPTVDGLRIEQNAMFASMQNTVAVQLEGLQGGIADNAETLETISTQLLTKSDVESIVDDKLSEQARQASIETSVSGGGVLSPRTLAIEIVSTVQFGSQMKVLARYNGYDEYYAVGDTLPDGSKVESVEGKRVKIKTAKGDQATLRVMTSSRIDSNKAELSSSRQIPGQSMNDPSSAGNDFDPSTYGSNIVPAVSAMN